MKIIGMAATGVLFALNALAQASDEIPFTAEEYQRAYYSQVAGFEIPSVYNPKLYEAVSEWLNVPYRYAGNSANGIDCSAFVSLLFEKVYGLNFTGTSAEMAMKAKAVKKHNLAEGNLVFFRIRKKRISHVGICLDNKRFVHASRTSGVTISSMDDPYYKKYFAKGGSAR